MTVLAGCIALSVGIGTEEFYRPVHADFVRPAARDFELRSAFATQFIFEGS
jgi:hypothetical protein